MIAKALNWLIGDLKPVHLDGMLYILIAVFAAMQITLTSDEVYKYANPYFVFYTKAVVGCCGAAVGALKMFRSNSYAEHRKETGNTDRFTKP